MEEDGEGNMNTIIIYATTIGLRYIDSPLKKRNDGVREIYKRETAYVANLRVVVKV